MKIYFDLCVIQRPLDTPSHIRITLESEAVLGLFALCESGRIECLSSEVLFFEGERSSLAIRREHTQNFLKKSKQTIIISEKEKLRAKELVDYGIKPLDALRLASAESGKADYFCTCDDKIIKKSLQIENLKVKVINPVELVQEIEK